MRPSTRLAAPAASGGTVWYGRRCSGSRSNVMSYPTEISPGGARPGKGASCAVRRWPDEHHCGLLHLRGFCCYPVSLNRIGGRHSAAQQAIGKAASLKPYGTIGDPTIGDVRLIRLQIFPLVDGRTLPIASTRNFRGQDCRYFGRGNVFRAVGTFPWHCGLDIALRNVRG